MTEVPHPAEWQKLTLITAGRAKFTLCFAYTCNPIDAGILRAMKLPPETKTGRLSFAEACDLGSRIEDWIRGQSAKAKGLKFLGERPMV